VRFKETEINRLIESSTVPALEARCEVMDSIIELKWRADGQLRICALGNAVVHLTPAQQITLLRALLVKYPQERKS
jgi:hypothetical protein